MSTSIAVYKNNLLSQFGAHIHKSTDSVSYLGRLWKTIQIIKEENGYIAAAAAGSSMVAASIYTFTFSYFCLEGVVRSYHEVDLVIKEEGHLAQNIGDVGGWLALPFFSVFALRALLHQCIREKEFERIQPICREWYTSLQEKSSLPANELYIQLNCALDEVAGQCLFYKSVTKRKLIALDVFEELKIRELENENAEISLDKQLQSVYREIEKERSKALVGSQYVHRLRTGLQVAEHRNWSLITGVACPILLGFASICSAIGTPILGEKLFVEEKELVEVGHFGEWPNNLIESSVVAYALNRDLVLKGDIYLLSCIFRKHLDLLDPSIYPAEGNKNLHNRLCVIANEEIQQLRSRYFSYSSLSFDRFC